MLVRMHVDQGSEGKNGSNEGLCRYAIMTEAACRRSVADCAYCMEGKPSQRKQQAEQCNMCHATAHSGV